MTLQQKVEVYGKDAVLTILKDLIKERENAILSKYSFQKEVEKERMGATGTDLFWYWSLIEMNSLSRSQGLQDSLKKLRFQVAFIEGRVKTMDIASVKQHPIEDLLDHSTVKRRMSKRILFLCPLHQEKTASFVLFKENNTWHCFGCNRGGDVISLYMQLHGVTFKKAIRELSGYPQATSWQITLTMLLSFYVYIH